MKLKIVLITLIVISSQQNMLGMHSSKIPDFNLRMNQIFNDMDSIITHSLQQNKTVQEHFRFVSEKIKSGELVVDYDSTLEYDFFGCSSFNINKGASPKFNMTFGKFVIDKYSDYPALIYAIVMHTFQYAYDYYNNQELFIISTENKIENVFFKMDAIAIEALFLKSYITDTSNLGPFEKFLIADLNNGLLSSPTLFLETDLALLHTMDELKYKSGSSNTLLRELKKMGDNLLKKSVFENRSDWENYCTLITLKTYVFYSKQVIFDIVYTKDNVSQDQFDFDLYVANRSTIDEIIKMIDLNKDYYNLHDEIMKVYGNEYKK